MLAAIRKIVALPFVAVQCIAGGSLVLFVFAAKLLLRASHGGHAHVYMPIVRTKRLVRGEPRWQVHDCVSLGVHPRTDEERERARASDELVLVKCVCGKPECAVPKHGVFIRRQA